MIEEVSSSRFSISILDNGYSVLITINSQINENLNVTSIKRKEDLFVFQEVSFGFNLSF